MGPSFRIFKELAQGATEYHVLAQSGTLTSSIESRGNLFLHRVPASSAKVFLVTSYRGTLLVKKYSVDRLVCQDPVLGGLAAVHSAKLFRVPLMAELHTDVYFRYLASANPVLRALGRVAQHVLRNATRVRALDRIQARLLEGVGVDPAAMVLVPYRVDSNFFDPRLIDRATARRKFRYGDEELVIVSIGRFVEQKGYAQLLNVFGKVVESRPAVRLAIAGGGPLEETYRRVVTREGIDGIVRLQPWTSQEELRELLAAADLYVQPSLAGKGDWMPRTILEAMAMELPVIATDVAGISDVVRDRRTGMVVPAGDNERLIAALIELGGDEALRRRYGQEGRHRASSTYGWNQGFRRYRDALYSLGRSRAATDT